MPDTTRMTVNEYRDSLSPSQQSAFDKILKMIRTCVPKDTEEVMAYGLPSWRNGIYLLHAGAFKNHVGLYPGPAAIQQYEAELSEFKTSKGSIHLPYDLPFPENLIQKLIDYNFSQRKPQKT